MSVDYVILSPPTDEPVSLALAKTHCRVYTDDENEGAYIQALIAAARELTEVYCNRSWCSEVRRATFDAFPEGNKPISLNYGPVTSVSITYGPDDVELDDEANTLVGDTVKPVDKWPSTSGPVKVTYHAGAQDVDDVPQSAKLAILFLVSGWYENRMSVSATTMNEVPLTVRALLASLWRATYP